nr:aldehyde dehydrogenase family protein [Natrinema ejinorense]
MPELETLADDGQLRNYANGQWTEITGSNGQDIVNPATGETLGHVPFSDEANVDRVVGDALEAFQDWQSTPVEERIQPLFEFKQLLEEHESDLAELVVQEHGKTLAEARGEVRRGIENVEVACGIPSMMQAGNLAHAAPEIDESAVRQPLGVFTAITPFNFPAMIPLWFLPYAVATGNTFILKPSEQDPLTARLIFQLIDEAGFPDGVVNMVHGGPEAVNALLDHDDIAGASFVGSTPIAKHVYERGAKNGKRVQAQGGAKNHVIVTESADLDFAAEKVLSASCACAGERCLALDNVVIEDSIYDDFVDRTVELADEMTVSQGLEDDVDMGALITPNTNRTCAITSRRGSKRARLCSGTAVISRSMDTRTGTSSDRPCSAT